MRTLLLAAPVLALAACSPAEDKAAPVRVAIETPAPSPIAAPPAPEQPDDTEWRVGGEDEVVFGVEGGKPLLSLTCKDGALGEKRLAITRHWAAQPGKGALLALIGNLRLRVPVDAVPPDRWRGSLPVEDQRWRILDDRFTATLPGGGLLQVPASSEARELLRQCRADARVSAAEQQSVFN